MVISDPMCKLAMLYLPNVRDHGLVVWLCKSRANHAQRVHRDRKLRDYRLFDLRLAIGMFPEHDI